MATVLIQVSAEDIHAARADKHPAYMLRLAAQRAFGAGYYICIHELTIVVISRFAVSKRWRADDMIFRVDAVLPLPEIARRALIDFRDHKEISPFAFTVEFDPSAAAVLPQPEELR